jgi:hypothetical protein
MINLRLSYKKYVPEAIVFMSIWYNKHATTFLDQEQCRGGKSCASAMGERAARPLRVP